LPDEQVREAMLQQFLPSSMVAEDFPYKKIASKLNGYSGSDIKLACKEAAMKPLRALLNKVEEENGEDSGNWWEPVDPKSGIELISTKTRKDYRF
jgi:katanin p60 ATPase-containing subunit A1